MEDHSASDSRESHSQTSESSGGTAPANGKAPHEENPIIGLLEIVGGLVFVTVGVALGEVGMHLWALIFYFLAILCGIILVSHRAKSWSLFGVLTVLDIALFAFLIIRFENESKPEPERRPHFAFLFRADSSADEIELTNSFLLVTNLEGINSPAQGCLILPIGTGQSNLSMLFSVINDSTVLAEDTLVVVGAPEHWVLNPGPGWNPARYKILSINDSGSTVNNGQSWEFRPPIPLLSGNGADTPAISVFAPSVTNGDLLTVQARAKDSPTTALAFRVAFVSTNIFPKPFIWMIANVNGHDRLNISSNDVFRLRTGLPASN